MVFRDLGFYSTGTTYQCVSQNVTQLILFESKPVKIELTVYYDQNKDALSNSEYKFPQINSNKMQLYHKLRKKSLMKEEKVTLLNKHTNAKKMFYKRRTFTSKITPVKNHLNIISVIIVFRIKLAG